MSNTNKIDEALRPRPDAITVKHQRMAADPERSAWVSANAGSGKTYVLSTRVIRLLLDGVEPSKILCLTYTKTAAAEMKNRVFSRLGEWVTMDDAELNQTLTEITGKRVSDSDMAFARTLFARALETPGGLKIQTIHAFCEALLHRFPLEANIAGHFELIEDMAASLLVADARRQLLTGKGDEARAAIQRVLASKGESGLENLLDEIIGKRQKLDALIGKLGEMDERRAAYLAAFGFSPDDTSETVMAGVWPALEMTADYMVGVRDEAAATGKSRAYEFAYGCVVALNNWQKPGGFDELRSVLLKADGKPYKPSYLFAKDILATFSTLPDLYEQAASVMADAVEKLNLLAEIDQTLDALTIADRLLKLYAEMKNRRGLLDFDDLIARTEAMLSKDNVAAWVRYKLDQGIDHILVDEAQDTSPAQWRVIKILADEFFDGDGARDIDRTVFAVGDEKQSIYSFQGADPAEFGAARDHFSQKLRQVAKPFEPLGLEASFRSTHDVLAAVDHVFAFADHQKGLAAGDVPPQTHRSLREKQPGQVEVWDWERPQEKVDEEDWRKPVDHAQKPAVIVAQRIATHIKNWLDTGERLQANSKKITAGDILVLVRKRDAFVHALAKALKVKDVPVAGADRLAMTGHIAVLDLMALGRVMLNQRDDLSLAALLRSPLFGWSDEQLFDLSHDRGDTPLYGRLRDLAVSHDHVGVAFETLQKWRVMARNLPVFEFYNAVLGVSGGRAKLIGRLGPETADMLDEFLNFAIAQERTGPVSLQTFISTLDNFGPEIKREMDGQRDEVRIMTVHGAKGLEAPIVFLVDPGSPAFSGKSAPTLLPYAMPNKLHTPIDAVLWGGAGKIKSSVSNQIFESLKEKATEEYNRLLYVGMTRAADRLIVAGYAGVNGGKEGTWREMVQKGLEAHARLVDYDGFGGYIYPANQTLPAHAPCDDTENAAVQTVEVPACFASLAPAEPPAARPLVPSGASGLAIEPDRQDTEAEAPSSLLNQFQAMGNKYEMSPALAVKRGTLIHKLLQILPSLAPGDRRARAATYCKHIDDRWSDDDIAAMLDQVFNVLDNAQYATFFAENGQAEVSVMGTVILGDTERAVSGVIDRLTVTENDVHIIDYKTNANPPKDASGVPAVYWRQMALYQALVAPLYPEKKVHAALLFTATPQLITLDQARLDKALDDMNPA